MKGFRLSVMFFGAAQCVSVLTGLLADDSH